MKLDLEKLKIGKKNKPEAAEENQLTGILVKDGQQLGEYVKAIRKNSKIGQEEVATFANISRVAISEFENGKSDIKLSTLLKILKACNATLEVREKR